MSPPIKQRCDLWGEVTTKTYGHVGAVPAAAAAAAGVVGL